MALENLSPEAVLEELEGLEGWSLEGGMIVRTFKFASFADAIAFVKRAADVAEDYDHHPDIDVRYDKVRIATVTHATDGITKRDVELARRIDAAGGSGGEPPFHEHGRGHADSGGPPDRTA